MFGFVLWLLLFVRAALAGPPVGPSMQSAPESFAERPVIAAPAGGWWTEEGQYARVHAGGSDRVTARRLADHAAVAVPRLAKRLGVPSGATVEIYIAPSQVDFDGMQPGTPPEWADGTAYPNWNLVFLRSPSARPGTAEPLEQVLDHEIVHILVGNVFAPNVPPRWLQEGLAQFWTGELGPRTGDDLSNVLFGRDTLFSLHQLNAGFRGDPVRARLSYDAAADFIGFVASRYGENAVRSLVEEMAHGAYLDDAVLAATGDDVKTVEGAWRGHWSDPALLLRAVASSGLLWAAGAVLVLAGAWRVRRRARQKLARWEREEREWMERRMRALAEARGDWVN
jgi:hypothetical protein